MSLMATRCWSCWWQEGARCYRKDLASIAEEGGRLTGEEITTGLIARCGPFEGYDNKRTILERVIPREMLVIVSEESKKREKGR
jgi:hypothetical protein